MAKIALGVQYNGAHYYGWQSQSGLPTVQQSLEDALSKVADSPIAVVCAGRTDRGVHGLGQVVHFETDVVREPHAWHLGANAYLPSDIAVNWAKPVPDDFHARFSARSREYRYLIYNHSSRPGMLHELVKWQRGELNLEAMQRAANYLLGEHDFSSFRGAGCQANHAVRTVHHLQLQRHGVLWSVDIKANAFLLHMVRNIVGSLLRVGLGLETVEWMQDVLLACDRREAGMTIEPSGLSLTKVNYEPHFEIPETSDQSLFLV